MYWQQDSESSNKPADVVDVAFEINCKVLPLNHAPWLHQQINQHLPWLATEKGSALHLIHGAASGNGWERPEADDSLMYLSRRIKLKIRVPKSRVDDCKKIVGLKLDINGFEMLLGTLKVLALKPFPALFSRYVIDTANDEDLFLENIYQKIRAYDLQPKKLLCGKPHQLLFSDANFLTRSIMIADLKPDESILLQQRGLGSEQHRGCGVLIPHKDISSVKGDE
jgi:CRISPR-associated protein Cas6